MIYTFDHNSETATITCDIANKRSYFSLYFHVSVIVIRFDLKICDFTTYFVHFYLFYMDILLNFEGGDMK